MTHQVNDIRFPIYLDNHATTRVDPRVVDAMLPYFTENYGNASSRDHRYGWHAKEAVELARRTIAGSINAEPNEIVFTSGATESNNLALKGIAEAYRGKGNHIVTCATEHRSVLDACKNLESCGFRITIVPVDTLGRIDLSALELALTADTVLVSVMAANNEIGTIAPIDAIGALCRSHGILFHTDASQAYGRIALDTRAMRIDAMSLSAHKLYGPKGVGALFVRRNRNGVRLIPQMDGGGQEFGLRSGTLNVPGIAGFGEAAVLAIQLGGEENSRIASLRDALQEQLTAASGTSINGDEAHRLPNNLNISFHGVAIKDILTEIREISISAGSACTSEEANGEHVSHVLHAIGLDRDLAQSTIRFGLGRFTTEAEIVYTAKRITEFIHHQRPLSRRHSSVKDLS
jgi:cysteine desulfurase